MHKHRVLNPAVKSSTRNKKLLLWQFDDALPANRILLLTRKRQIKIHSASSRWKTILCKRNFHEVHLLPNISSCSRLYFLQFNCTAAQQSSLRLTVIINGAYNKVLTAGAWAPLKRARFLNRLSSGNFRFVGWKLKRTKFHFGHWKSFAVGLFVFLLYFFSFLFFKIIRREN